MKNLIIIILLSFSLIHVQAVTINSLAFTKATYDRFEKAEATFTLGSGYSNPYDSAIVAVDAEITPPSGPVILVPCFYYIPCTFTVNNATENGAGAKWMLRYAPTLTGNYSVRIRVMDGITSYSGFVNFNVVAGSRKGFIRIDATNNQFMRFDNNTPYYPVGFNLCWNDGNLVNYFKNYMDNLDPNKVNWTRYWLTDFARQAIEWRAAHWSGWYAGLGNYSQRPCAMLDSVLNLCEQKDIYMQLVLQHHGQVSTSTNPAWAENPYNTANGGPINNAGDFFFNTTVKTRTKKMYRYVVARWGYSTNVLSWELFNEVEFSDGSDPNIDTWHNEMSQYLKLADPNDHIVNSSSGGDNSTVALFDNNAAMDQLQWHTYAGSIEKVLYNESRNFITTYNKPMMCGEFGTGVAYPNGGGHPDNWGDHVRKSMWIGMMSDAPNMFWFWDEYIGDKNLFSIFKPLGDYLTGEDIVTSTGGNGKKIKFSNNPLVTGNVLVSPSLNAWGGTNVPNPFTSVIDANGNASNVTGLHSYIHGTFQGARNRDLSFTVTYQAAGNVELNVTNVSGSGSKQIQVYVDAVLVNTWNPGGAGTYTHAGIPAGTHTIRLFSTGQDWVEFSNIRFTNVQFRPCDAWGYTGATKAYGYVNDLSYGDWADPVAIPNITGAALRVGPLTPGSYNVEYWNPQTGAISSGGVVVTTLDSVTLALPNFKKDLAYKVSSASLPVKLLDFNGLITPEKNVLLNWTTMEEVNNDHFDILRSIDNMNFMRLGSVKSKGSGLQGISKYSYEDTEPNSGANYYKLVQYDKNGTAEASPIIVVYLDADPSTAYPVPAAEFINIKLNFPSNNKLSYSIVNVSGQTIRKGSLTNSNSIEPVKLNISGLPSGQYYLILMDEGTKSETIRFIKN